MRARRYIEKGRWARAWGAFLAAGLVVGTAGVASAQPAEGTPAPGAKQAQAPGTVGTGGAPSPGTPQPVVCPAGNLVTKAAISGTGLKGNTARVRDGQYVRSADHAGRRLQRQHA